MAQGLDGIDHVVILVPDLDIGRADYARLGFHVTPRGTHSPHMGTGNHLLILERDYVELLGVLKPTPNNAEWRARLQAGHGGLSAIALSTQDHLEAHATLRARGLAPLEPLEFSRPVEVLGGQRDAAFAVVRLPGDSVPDLGLFVCGHKTRDLVWRPEWQAHANTAYRIVSVSLSVKDVDLASTAWQRPFGTGAAVREHGKTTIRTGGRAEIELMTADEFPRHFPGLGLAGTAAITFGVRDLTATAGVLERNGIPHAKSGKNILASSSHGGVGIRFVSP